MPAPDPLSSPNRLRLGQGVAGGKAALPTLGAPDSTPRPPVGLPRLRPPAAPAARFTMGPPATDVTPAPLAGGPLRPQSLEGRGAAILERGNPFVGLANRNKPLGAGEKKTIKLLQNPDRLYKPENKQNLKLILKPSPKVQAAIDQDPHLSQNQQALQQHILTNGPVKLPAQDLIKNLHATVGSGKMDLSAFVERHKGEINLMDDESKQRFSAAVDVAQHDAANKNLAMGKPHVAGLQEPIQRIFDEGGILGSAFNQAFETVTGMVPGLYQLGRHPIKTGEAIGKATKDYYGPLFTGDFAKFKKNIEQRPLTPILDLAAGYGAVIGTGARIGAASAAVREAAAAGAIEDLGNGAARVGGRYTIHPMRNGRYMIRDSSTNKVVTNMADQDSAIAHSQSLGGADVTKNSFQTALHAFTHPEMYGKTRGSIMAQYETHNAAAQARIGMENDRLIDQLKDVAEDPNLRLNRRSRREVLDHAKADFNATMTDLRNRPKDILSAEPEFMNRATANVRAGAVQSYRELLAGVRLGAIYLRPAYLPNNWAGNAFMNLTHQGFLAPINLAKSVVMHNHMDGRNLAMIDKAVGQSAAQAAYEGIPRGFLASAGHPLVEAMGKMADQPFRRAAFLHEARRMGYTKLEDVNGLLNKFRSGDEKAQQEVANIGRKAQEEIVKFGHMGPEEKAIANNVFFVYNWVKGATRYASRFPLQHPIQADIYSKTSVEGHKWVDSQMGGVPWFLAGSIPVGHDKDGNPILINPFALNPLGTSVDVARAAAGSYKALVHPKQFNKYADATLVDLTNPLVQTAAKHFLGGDTASTQYELSQSIAPWRLAQDLEHPGRGSMFPMTRQEALGHYIFGALYPRKASQDAISRALERQNQNNPIALIGNQVADFEKRTGTKVPSQFVGQLKGDIEQLQMIKDFQSKYAESKGSQGFKSLPPQNRAEAAIEYLQQHGHLPKEDLASYKEAVASVTNDAQMNQIANALWGATNAGTWKRKWDELRKTSDTTKMTPPRK